MWADQDTCFCNKKNNKKVRVKNRNNQDPFIK